MSKNNITVDSTKRSGKPCIKNLRITVYDILSMLSQGMSYEDILVALVYAADREHKTFTVRLSA